jgi:hypothetical protein
MAETTVEFQGKKGSLKKKEAEIEDFGNLGC